MVVPPRELGRQLEELFFCSSETQLTDYKCNPDHKNRARASNTLFKYALNSKGNSTHHPRFACGARQRGK
jgi:hypothetical protein